MRIVIAPNAFKGSLSALDAAEAIAEGVRVAAADADLVLVPIADGGDGTVDALVAATHGERRTLRVRGPLGDPVDAAYGLIDAGATAVIEMAKAAGLALVPPAKRHRRQRDQRRRCRHGAGARVPSPRRKRARAPPRRPRAQTAGADSRRRRTP